MQATSVNWCVAWTKARCEKALTSYLETRSVPHFLPTIVKRRVYGRQIRTSDIPLFSGYVFFDSSAIDRRVVFESRKVVEILVPSDPAKLDAELTVLRRALSIDPSLRESRFGGVGTPVVISRGPFQGLTGEIARVSNNTCLILRVSFLGKAAEVKIDEAFVEPQLV